MEDRLEAIKDVLKKVGPIVDIRFDDWDETVLVFEDGTELNICQYENYDRCGNLADRETELELDSLGQYILYDKVFN